jgi:hypothetical protein
MSTSVEDWQSAVDPHFGFLNERGFQLNRRFASASVWATDLVYAAHDRAISVERSVEFNRAEVVLIRLYEGAMPDLQIRVTAEPVNRLLLDNVLQARDPQRYREIQQLGGLGEPELQRQLSELASALRDVAGDFLTGSFAAMDDGERVIRQRLEGTHKS